MTTIAIRGNTVAADSQITSGDIRGGHAAKIVKKGRAIAGFTGRAIGGQAFLDWFLSGMHGPPPMEQMENATGIIVAPGQPLVLLHEEGWERRWTHTAAFGSGSELAYGALLAGKSPAEAVEIAAAKDIYTGGPVRVLTTD